MITDKLKQAWQNSISALIPNSCALCHLDSSDVVCSACQLAYFQTEQHRCLQCALPLPPASASPRCGDCLSNPPAFDRTVTVCDYAAPQDQLVLSLKFGHQLALAPWFARMLRDSILQRQGSELPDLLCAVPLGAKRLAERGFNQAWEITRPLSKHLGVPGDVHILQRSRETAMQSGLPTAARARNVKHAFCLYQHDMDSVRDLHLGIVDDVMTTGMTMHEIATMLKRHGAAKVTAYVFARTLPHIH
ncbi:MAG: phosphoribosyltransferase family protein [Undibacterium umbellatum]|uniref:phosphoribosyltransferase family protein n=1 Tax=Undibacterium umbellatum TaxID=2762300 RepID=UPI003BB5A78C